MNTICHAELDRTHALPEFSSGLAAPARRKRSRLAWFCLLFLLFSLAVASLSIAQPVAVLLLILVAGATLVAGERSLRRPGMRTGMDFHGLVEMKAPMH